MMPHDEWVLLQDNTKCKTEQICTYGERSKKIHVMTDNKLDGVRRTITQRKEQGERERGRVGGDGSFILVHLGSAAD